LRRHALVFGRMQLNRATVGRLAALAIAMLVIGAAACSLALGKASHRGWPSIDGRLAMHKSDQHGSIHGTHKSDELLGGHGNDVIYGKGDRDVIWGDYKPYGQPGYQSDVLRGGSGRDFIYASHGHNTIHAGAGNDVIHAHFGRGSIDCGSGWDWVNVSHMNKRKFHTRNCERVG
jgi:hypothetical protein